MLQLTIAILFLLLLGAGYWIWLLRKIINNEQNKRAEQQQLLVRDDRLSEMGSMMGNIAHQWKQPLNNIALLVLNIQNSYRKNQLTTEYLEDKVFAIEETLEYMAQTIEDFSDYLSPRKTKNNFYINDSVEKAMELTMPTLNKSRVDIIFMAEDEYKFMGRKNELTQVLIILINNARDALMKDTENQDKTIEINLEEHKEKIQIIVRDNGLGIPKHLLNKIFEPYFTTNNDTKGRGLGLYMAKMIVEGLEGTIKIFNDKGAVFELEF
jgi:C4-dicarboxylate-specific signal transduction histidine kinase